MNARTAPCLLQELLVYDPRPERLTNCSHQFAIKSDRSVLPELDQRPDIDTRWELLTICQLCRCHLDLDISFAASILSCPAQDFPLHHFLLQKHTEPTPGARQNSFDFACSNTQCHADLRVCSRTPALNQDDVRLLTDPVLLKTRWKNARLQNADLPEPPIAETLDAFRSYLRDAIANKSDSKRIPVKNKRFLTALGADAKSLMERLGFIYEPEDEQAGSPLAYWRLPIPDDSLKALLEDVRDEVDIFTASKRTITSTREFERVLSTQNCRQMFIPFRATLWSRNHEYKQHQCCKLCTSVIAQLLVKSFIIALQAAITPYSLSFFARVCTTPHQSYESYPLRLY